MQIKKAWLLLALILASLGLAGCEFTLAADVTPPPGVQQPSPLPESQSTSAGPTYPLVAPNPSAAANNFAEKCAPCHGPTGLGNGPQAAQLPNPVPPIGQRDISFAASPADWYNVVTQGRVERYMPPFLSLTDGQRWDVVAYTLSLSTTAEELAEGQALYEANCAACHGDTGAGDGPAAASLSVPPVSFLNQEWMAQRSAMALSAGILAGKAPGMPAFGDQFDQQETFALVSYLRSLSFSPGSALAASSQIEESAEATPAGEAESTPSTDATGETASSEESPATGDVAKGTVTGRLLLGNGESVFGDEVEVILHGLDSMQLVLTQTMTIESDGSFVFDNVDLVPSRVYVTIAEYQGATYGSEFAVVEEGVTTMDLPITVYETTSDPSVLTVDRLHMFFDFPNPGTVQVVQLYVISNASDRTLVPEEDQLITVPFSLPEGATNLQFQEGFLGERYIMDEDGLGFHDTVSVRPSMGQYQVMYAFELPYEGDRRDIVQEFPLPLDAVIVMSPADGVSINSADLIDSGTRDVEGAQYKMLTGEGVAVDESLELSISGRPAGTEASAAPGTDLGQTSLVIGLGALGLVLVGAGVWLYRRNQTTETVDDADADNEIYIDDVEIVVYTTPEMVMDAIIVLDDRYAAGELPEDIYEQRRAALKARLQELMDEA